MKEQHLIFFHLIQSHQFLLHRISQDKMDVGLAGEFLCMGVELKVEYNNNSSYVVKRLL